MESIDTTTATGRMFIKIVGIFAEFERENLAERISFGFEQKAREGNFNSYYVNGYDYVKGTGEFIVNPEEAKIVREIYDLYLQGNSMHQIANHLIKINAPNKRGGKWQTATIYSILTNTLYIGKISYKGKGNKEAQFIVDTDKYERIIDEDTFNRVQELLKGRRKNTLRHYPKENTYFLSFLSCNKCGKKLGTRQHRDPRTKAKTLNVNYYCPNRLKGECNATSVSQNKVENAFIQFILDYNFDVITNELGTDEKTLEDEKKDNIIAEISKGKNQLDRLKNLFINEKISLEEYREFSTTWNEKIKLLEAELDELIFDEVETVSPEIVKDIVGNLRENWTNLTNEEKKQFLTMFITDIKVESVDRKANITDVAFANPRLGVKKNN